MNFSINKGTNISHWLSQHLKGDDFKKRFSERDCSFLAELGFDHIRIPFEEQVLWREDGQKNNEAWDMLHQGVDWALVNNLNVVLDLHSTYSHHFCRQNENSLFSDIKAQKHFAEIWKSVALEFEDLPLDRVAFELLNEPVAKSNSDWNKTLLFPYNAIRETQPERIIAIGSNRWCQAVTFPYFTPPEDDENLILVFHYYNPMGLTHYKASWMEFLKDYQGKIQYPGQIYPDAELLSLPEDLKGFLEKENSYFNADVMKKQLMPVLDKGKSLNLKLWCNEFGVILNAPTKIAEQWYDDLFALFEQYDIAWTNWDFKGGFALVDSDNTLTQNGRIIAKHL